MKVVIPLQTVLVAIFLLGISVLLTIILKDKTTKIESFVESRDTDIQLQACPSGTQSFTQNGNTLCCDGDLQNGMCNGRTVCSLSNNSQQMPSCVTLLRKELRDKSNRFCPPTIQNYFENGKIRGCTTGSRTVDGKSLKQDGRAVKTCKVYELESDNLIKTDSCQNIKLQDKTVCPQGGKPALISLRSTLPAVLSCTVRPDGDPYPRTCYDDMTFTRYLTETKQDWKTNMNFDETLQFCSKARAYYIDKTLVKPQAVTPAPVKAKCIFNARLYADRYPDLKKAFGYNEAALKKHYIDNGIAEEREYTPGCGFNALRYAELNPDLKRAFGFDSRKLLNHYKQYGINEGRQINKL